MSEDEQTKIDTEVLERLCNQAMEHFDAVHVFVCRDASDFTTTMDRGAGNWITRYGQITRWVIQKNAELEDQVRRKNDQT